MFSLFKKQPIARISDPGKRKTPSISFSIAYVRVCEWAKNPIEHERPIPELLNQAADYADSISDKYILKKIEEARAEWMLVDKTITPKEFPSGKHKIETPEPFRLLDKTPKVTEEQSKKIAIFTSSGKYHTPATIASAQKSKEPIRDVSRLQRNITSSYSFRPDREELIKTKDTGDKVIFEKALIDALEKIDKKNC